MKERDLSLVDKSSKTEPVFDSVWGNLFDEDEANDVLICNILIPEAYWSMVKYENGEFNCRFLAPYMPDTRNFRIRIVALQNGEYHLFSTIRGDFGLPVSSYALSKNIAAPISAAMLPYIDVNGEFLVRLVENDTHEALDKAYIYSSKKTDLTIDYSDDQASQLLSICGPGKSYRYPTTGVGIIKYLNRVVAHTNLDKVLDTQFQLDNKPLEGADFDNQSGNLDVLFRPEKEIIDTDVCDIADLNIEFFERFTDDFVRRNTVITEVADTDFIGILDEYERILEIILFIDETTSSVRIADKVEPGEFNGEGEIIESDKYYIVSATLEPDTIIMFDDETNDEIKDAPIFIVNDTDETRLYTALVEQPYWITETCHKCFILKKRATVKYMIRQDLFSKEKGLYSIPQTSANIKNMLGLVQDINTGRLLGIVSNNTNINDMVLDEVTQYIYASHITD